MTTFPIDLYELMPAVYRREDAIATNRSASARNSQLSAARQLARGHDTLNQRSVSVRTGHSISCKIGVQLLLMSVYKSITRPFQLNLQGMKSPYTDFP